MREDREPAPSHGALAHPRMMISSKRHAEMTVGARGDARAPTGAKWRMSACYLFGCGVIRRYGRRAFHPFGKSGFACSSLSEGTITQSSPSFQLAGVATL